MTLPTSNSMDELIHFASEYRDKYRQLEEQFRQFTPMAEKLASLILSNATTLIENNPNLKVNINMEKNTSETEKVEVPFSPNQGTTDFSATDIFGRDLQSQILKHDERPLRVRSSLLKAATRAPPQTPDSLATEQFLESLPAVAPTEFARNSIQSENRSSLLLPQSLIKKASAATHEAMKPASTAIEMTSSKVEMVHQAPSASPSTKQMQSLATSPQFRRKESFNSHDLSPLNSKFWKTGFNPISSYCILLRLVFLILHIIKLWYIPLAIAFEIQIPHAFSICLTIINICDMALEFLTVDPNFAESLPRKGLEFEGLRQWQHHYLQHGFILDLITAIPLDLLPFDGSQYLWGVRLLRLYKVPGTLRSSPLYIELQRRMQRNYGISQSMFLIFPVTVLFAAFLHVQACATFLGGRLDEFSNPEIESYENKSIWQQYTWSLFVSVGNTFPIGYHPQNAGEQWIVIAFAIVGAGMFATIIGTISSFAMNLDVSGKLYAQRLDELQEYMRWKDLNPELREKVLKYFELKYRGKYFEEGMLLNDMNNSLRMEIAVHNCRALISKVSFLRRQENDGRDELFVGKIASAFIPCYFIAGDVIFTKGDVGSEMYFIVSGTVQIIVQGAVVATLKEGQVFGEVALIGNIPRTATAKAVSSCMVYYLSRNSFVSIIEEFEDVKRTVGQIYHERMEKVRFEEEARKLEIAKSLAAKVTFLNRHKNDGRDDEFLQNIGKFLIPVFFVKGDVIFSQGEKAEELYFIKSGTVEISLESRVVNTLQDGAFFGELALIAQIPRTATARAASTTTLFKLTRDDFLKILDVFPDVTEQINDVYIERMTKFKREENVRRKSVDMRLSRSGSIMLAREN